MKIFVGLLVGLLFFTGSFGSAESMFTETLEYLDQLDPSLYGGYYFTKNDGESKILHVNLLSEPSMHIEIEESESIVTHTVTYSMQELTELLEYLHDYMNKDFCLADVNVFDNKVLIGLLEINDANVGYIKSIIGDKYPDDMYDIQKVGEPMLAD